ncbi:Golgi resident protein GCP60 isoform X1 [Hetaerina americana]|uniref:Golgi resident protein GCP60 isoform X1 n=1 Tax=Hetaerina americana TaxID=62018 RepID=UPI003A7F292D
MAANGELTQAVNEDDRLGTLPKEKPVNSVDGEFLKEFGLELKDLYRLGLKFYKENVGKALQLSYKDKLKLVAYTQQVSHGKFNADSLPPLGVLDVIGKDRRLAWQSLGDMPKVEAMINFLDLLVNLCNLFKPFIAAHVQDIKEKERKMKEDLEKKREFEEEKRLIEETKAKEEEEKMKQEQQRRQIQEALNQQTYHHFKAYAEQQFPGNPEQQAVLIRQLQEQHYHQYMQQLYQQQQKSQELCKANPVAEAKVPRKEVADASEVGGQQVMAPPPQDEETHHLLSNGSHSTLPQDGSADEDCVEAGEGNLDHCPEESDECDEDVSHMDLPPTLPASMWTRKEIKEFKESIQKEGGDAIIRVGHGETVTVRVPTHEDGTCLFWEFATDSYDIGFGVYFEWIKSPTNQVSVHISESEEEEEDEDEDDEEGLGVDDVERGGGLGDGGMGPKIPMSVIVPVYRRDCQEEVYAGSHPYPGQGVYLLKFDNSYSLWRSKTLYYRVYYTR